MFKYKKTKLSPLIIAVVVCGILFSVFASTVFFGMFHQKLMINSAAVSSKQTVSQADVAEIGRAHV